jgi:hypothetical protein
VSNLGKQKGANPWVDAPDACHCARSEKVKGKMSTCIGRARRWRYAGLILLVFVFAVPHLRAAEHEDYDAYTIRFDGFWFYAHPSGTFTSKGDSGGFNLHADADFTDYSTFSGGIDWKFTRKNHLYFNVTPFTRTKSFVTKRTITFQGQTFDPGAIVNASLQVNAYIPGYRYDIIRRKRGHLGIGVQLDLFDTYGSLNAAAQVTSTGAHQVSTFAKGSLRAPIPVAGPDVRLYLISNRLFVTGNVYGMYFFGYGNFLSTLDTLGLTITKHLSARGGYQLGSRLNVNTTSKRLGISLTQDGPIVGAEVSF